MLDFLCRTTECDPVLLVTQILGSIFLAILFLQSGIDKIVDRKGNLSWLTAHFARSPLSETVPLLLTVVMVTEIVAGALSAVGALALLAGSSSFAIGGVVVSAIALLMLFFGQRMAKDYEGAAVLAGYFLLVLFLLVLHARV
jgi:uncharacterized membrane protein YphA (DoxX/SURF4 family)